MALAGLKPIPVDTFGGLDVTTDEAQVGWGRAVAGVNVDVGTPGVIRTRDGSARVGAANALTATSVGIFPVAYGTNTYMLSVSGAGAGVQLDRVTPGGTATSVGSWAGTFDMVDFANIGTDTTTLTFIAAGAIGGTGITCRKYDGTTLAASVGKPLYLAVTPVSNRLVQGYFNTAADSPTGADGSPSTVFFSDAPAAPETFGANNFVHLHPGDGESITGMVAWRDMLFVFKQSKCFVFYGESKDASGNPIFQYRVIPLRSPVYRALEGQRFCVAGHNGVYFLATDGVYVTTGGDPVRVSKQLDGVFEAADGVSTYMRGISAAGRRVFVLSKASAPATLYVLDEMTGEWVTWEFVAAPTVPLVDWPQGFPYGRVAMYTAGRELYRTSASASDDAGSGFAASYQSGYQAPGGSGVETTIRETELVGTGSPQFSWSSDFGAFDTPVSVTLGVSPAVTRGLHSVAKAGEYLAYKLSSSSGAWSVRLVGPRVREFRGVGEKTS